MPKPKPRKVLTITEEELFVRCLLLVGPATQVAFNYLSANPRPGAPNAGIWFWLRETADGKAFMQCVLDAGEAKARAHKYYFRYAKWCQSKSSRRPTNGVIP